MMLPITNVQVATEAVLLFSSSFRHVVFSRSRCGLSKLRARRTAWQSSQPNHCWGSVIAEATLLAIVGSITKRECRLSGDDGVGLISSSSS